MGEAKQEQARCGLCGEPMPPGEEMFNYHGLSGPCPKPAPSETMAKDETTKTYPEFDAAFNQRKKAFVYHPPKPNQLPRYARIRCEGEELAKTLNTVCPPSRELALAMTKLEEAVMWANAAIARNE